jgi:outer membrane protein
MLMDAGNFTAAFCGVLLAINLTTSSVSLSAASEPNLPVQQTQNSRLESADPNQSPQSENPLQINIRSAILLAMENNKSLIVERMNPEIVRTFEKEELSTFDSVFAADASSRRAITERLERVLLNTESSTLDSITGSASLSKYFPTGTNVALEGSTNYTDSSLYGDTFTNSRLGISVTQALLQGLDFQANMARVNQARLDTLISEYEFRGFTEILLEEVESTFWDYALAQKQIEIYTDSLALAEQQLDEVQERINIGDLPEMELAAAQAEVALRKENLINARSNLASERLNLLRLLNPSPEINWNRDIVLQYQTTLPEIKLEDVEQHVQVALKMRPDLNQAKLQIQQGNLEVVRTKNGLLPRLDAFITFGKTGYADSFNRATNNIFGDSYDVTFGLSFLYPPSNRAARSRYTRAVLTKQQFSAALENLMQLIQVDVRTAYIEVTRTREQIVATAATRNFQEETLRAETEKFKVGKSTSLLVAQAQRDLVESQIAEIESFTNYLKALVSLYRLEGSLLQRRGISIPVTQPLNRQNQNTR